jgi:hypothetical protein
MKNSSHGPRERSGALEVVVFAGALLTIGWLAMWMAAAR